MLYHLTVQRGKEPITEVHTCSAKTIQQALDSFGFGEPATIINKFGAKEYQFFDNNTHTGILIIDR